MFTILSYEKTLVSFSISSLMLLFLSGCGQKPSYQLVPLKQKVAYDQVVKQTEKGDVTIRCCRCSKEYIRKALGKQGDALLGLRSHKRIVPVQISIENNSDYAWTLSPYDIHVPLVDLSVVKSRFVKGATQKGIASLGFYTGFGLLCISFGTAASILHPVVGASIFGLGCSMLITGPVFSHKTAAAVGQQNAYYEHVLDTLVLHKELTVHPHEQESRLVFIEQRNIPDVLNIRLCNARQVDHTMLYQLYLDMPGKKSQRY